MNRRLRINIAIRISSYITCYISSYYCVIKMVWLCLVSIQYCILMLHYIYRTKKIYCLLYLLYWMYLCIYVYLCFPYLRQHYTSVCTCKTLRVMWFVGICGQYYCYTISLHVANCRLMASLLLTTILSLSFLWHARITEAVCFIQAMWSTNFLRTN